MDELIGAIGSQRIVFKNHKYTNVIIEKFPDYKEETKDSYIYPTWYERKDELLKFIKNLLAIEQFEAASDKKSLKAFVKTIKDTFPKPINLTTASEQELRKYAEAYFEWQKGSQEREDLEKIIEEKIRVEEEETKKVKELARKEALERTKIKLTNLQSQSAKLSELGEKVARFIELQPNLTAKVWTKNGQMRIYVRDESMTRSDRGVILIENNLINLLNLKCHLDEGDFLNELRFSNLEDDLVRQQKTRSPEQIQEAIKYGQYVCDGEIASALDELYGIDGWDDRDRHDFEG